MKLKKVLALTLAGIMTVGLAACGGTKESSEKTEAGKEKQKLVIWSWGADEEKKSREAAVEAFQKAHPEIEVEHSYSRSCMGSEDDCSPVSRNRSGCHPDVTGLLRIIHRLL